MVRSIQILILEDSSPDLDLIQIALKRAQVQCTLKHVQTGAEFEQAISEESYDVILSDYYLPGYSGIDALHVAQKTCPDVPFIFVTGNMERETEIICLKAGATDYVQKDNLPRLGLAVTRALREAEDRRERRRAEDEQKKLMRAIERSPVSIVITDIDGKIEYVNPWFCNLTGYSSEEAINQNLRILQSGFTPRETYTQLWNTILAGRVWQGEFCNRKKDGELYWERASIAPVYNQTGQLTHFVAVKEEITESKKAEQFAQFTQRRLNSLVRIQQQTIGSMDEMLAFAIHEAAALSDSQIGFLHAYHEERQEFTLHRWSADLYPEIQNSQARILSLEEGGLLSEVVRQRRPLVVTGFDSIALPGLPSQHVSFTRLLLLPIFEEQRLVAVFGVANKPVDYTDLDAEQLELFAEAVWRLGQRLHMEEALRYREELFRELAETVSEVFWVRDMQSRTVIYVNPAYEQVWGRSCSSLYEQPYSFIESIHPGDRQRVQSALQTLNAGTLFDEQYRILRPDGQQRWVWARAFPVYNEQGQFYRVVGVAQDITERRQAEEKYKASETRYRAVVEQQTELISRWKPDTTRTFVNEAYCRFFGLRPEQAIGSSFLNLIDDEDLPAVLSKNASLASGKLNARNDIHRIVLPDGQVRWTEWTDMPLYNEAGQITEFQSVGRDVTERVLAEEKIRLLNVDLLSAYEETIEGWARALEMRDQETEGHSRRVVEMTTELARRMGVPEDELIHVRRGAILHDIGKMGIPDNILLKPGPLNGDEWAIMRQHPTKAFHVLSGIPFLKPALDIPHYHHENWDGSGYPAGLRGDEIPLAARIFSVVDVWDALLHSRPYRPGWPEINVLAYLKEHSGKQFDPRVVEMFLQMEK